MVQGASTSTADARSTANADAINAGATDVVNAAAAGGKAVVNAVTHPGATAGAVADSGKRFWENLSFGRVVGSFVMAGVGWFAGTLFGEGNLASMALGGVGILIGFLSKEGQSLGNTISSAWNGFWKKESPAVTPEIQKAKSVGASAQAAPSAPAPAKAPPVIVPPAAGVVDFTQEEMRAMLEAATAAGRPAGVVILQQTGNQVGKPVVGASSKETESNQLDISAMNKLFDVCKAKTGAATVRLTPSADGLAVPDCVPIVGAPAKSGAAR
ncbi:MAG: hypothetical protein V4735_01635 [Pseudomonadota bacterium]